MRKVDRGTTAIQDDTIEQLQLASELSCMWQFSSGVGARIGTPDEAVPALAKLLDLRQESASCG